ncbi:MAG: HAD hydrolase-like protein [Actinobacteria bacterium]|nr:HAD hydrolase-like protein [Actinomycetota bacterium]
MSRALLFDLDRTLVDIQSFTDYGSARRDAEVIIGTQSEISVPATDWSADTQAAMGLLVACSGNPLWQRVSDAIEHYEREAIPSSAPMPGLAEAWAACLEVPRAVVTLVPESVARAALHWHGIDTADLIVMGRRADQRPKPAADGLIAACTALGVDPRHAVMIGDSSWDLGAAEAAGTSFVGVPTRPENLPPGTRTADNLVAAVVAALA